MEGILWTPRNLGVIGAQKLLDQSQGLDGASLAVVGRLVKAAEIGGWRLVIKMQEVKHRRRAHFSVQKPEFVILALPLWSSDLSSDLRYVPGDGFLF